MLYSSLVKTVKQKMKKELKITTLPCQKVLYNGFEAGFDAPAESALSCSAHQHNFQVLEGAFGIALKVHRRTILRHAPLSLYN